MISASRTDAWNIGRAAFAVLPTVAHVTSFFAKEGLKEKNRWGREFNSIEMF
jgi:hypothetical protein